MAPRFLNLPKLRCRRCGWKWWPRPWACQEKLPKRCPNCTSPYWNTPYKRGPKRGWWKRRKKRLAEKAYFLAKGGLYETNGGAPKLISKSFRGRRLQSLKKQANLVHTVPPEEKQI